MSFANCRAVSPECPVEASPYGYVPNLAPNTLFLTIFAICGITQTVLGIRYKTWSWLAGLFIGTFLEMGGYVGRILQHQNVWNRDANKLQIVALVLAPSFIAAAIDLSLKHIVLIFGPEYSRIKPRLIPWIFIGVDFGAILVQAVGGALAAVAETNPSYLKPGNDIILAGLAVQVFQLAIFGFISLEYGLKIYSNRAKVSPQAMAYSQTFKFRWFIANIITAYLAVLIRCIYRIPEMASGWGQGLQRNEPLFLVLDGAMVVIAAICLTIAHPGIFFPWLGNGGKNADREFGLEVEEGREEKREVDSGSDSDRRQIPQRPVR